MACTLARLARGRASTIESVCNRANGFNRAQANRYQQHISEVFVFDEGGPAGLLEYTPVGEVGREQSADEDVG